VATFPAVRAVGPFAPLRHDRFRSLWLAGLVSFLGTWVHNVAARWTATTLATSPMVVAAVDTLQLLPMVMLSLAAGSLADRTDRRQLLVVTHLGLATVAGMMALFAWNGVLTLTPLFALTACIGLFGALNGPAWQATVPRQVPDEDVPKAVALMSTGFNLARAVGPGLGAWLLVTVGAGWAFAVNALSYGVIGALIWRLPPQLPWPASNEEHAPLTDRRLVRFYLVVMFFGLFAMPGLTLLPLVARDFVHGEARDYGALLSAFGAGAVAAGLFVATSARRFGERPVIALMTATSGIGFTVLAGARDMPTALIGSAICGAGWIGTISTVNAGVQMQADRAVRGRALAYYLTFAVGGQATGSFLGGALADIFGLERALQLHAFLLAGLALVVGSGIRRKQLAVS
jgi:MFS family permease